MRSRGLFLALVAGALFFSLAAAQAATLTVNSNADAGGTCPGTTCTLRQAIATALPGDTINFSAGITTINLTSAELLINKNLTISGPGANLLTVHRTVTPQFRIFNINGNFNVTISGLTIANGNIAGNGGGIYNGIGNTLTITSCAISGNTASGGGGGIYNLGAVTITNSTISGNSATLFGGGIFNDLDSAVNLTNSTLSGNSASDTGGGIYNKGGTNLTNSTLSGNSASASGGGIFNINPGIVNARNTIIARNTAASGAPDFGNLLTSQGYNLIGNTSGMTITGDNTGNQLNVDPLLGPLQNNGGPTFTQALLSGSTAIDGGHSSGSNTDQRGFTRPVDSPVIPNATGGDGSDIGACEVQAGQLPGCGNTLVTNNNDSGAGSLRSIIANLCGGETITFASSVVSPINLTSGELLLNKSLTISGPGANLLSVQRSASAGNFRIFHIAGNFNAAISGLTIANGNASSDFGGGISNNATLTLTNAAISGNSALFGGGGIYNNGGALTLTNATISGNSAGIGGSGILNSGTLTLTNSTISGNMALGGNGGGMANSGAITLTNVTISGNSASNTGGGIYNSSGTVTSRNTIIALNTAASGPDFNGALTSQNFNFIGNNSGASITPAQFSDQIGTPGSPKDPLLGPLQNNGGPTQTQALLTNSTAIDKGHSSGSNTDQRGFTRPVDFPGIPNATDGDGSDIGAFEVQVPAPTPTPSPTPASQAINLSTRMRVQTGDNVGIGGFIITGSMLGTELAAPKHVVLRAIGPSLTQFGVPDALADPMLELHGPGAFVTITNDNWRDDPAQAALLQADGLAPSNDLESAIDAILPPGAYTGIIRGKNNTSGVGLIEVYDLNPSAASKLANISTRAFVSTGDNIVIAGFILGHNSGVDRIVVRGIGPSLTAFGVPNALADPTLELRDSNGALLVANNNWQDDPVQAAELTAAGLAPANNLESGIATTLPPGLYTALLAGLNNGTGVGLVEVYDRGAP